MFADFIVDTTPTMALAIVKREPAEGAGVSPTLPARLEDVGAAMLEQMADMARRQAEHLERIEREARASRRSRWRR